MRECLGGVRRLLDGETLKETGEHFTFETIGLEQPAKGLPLLVASVGPKTIELAGSIADGLVVSVLAGPNYVAEARERLATAMQTAGRSGTPQLPVYALASVSRDRAAARAAARASAAFYLWIMGPTLMTGVYGVNDQLRDMLERGDAALIENEMPDEWLDWLAICGEPDECVDRIRALLDAGGEFGRSRIRPCRDDSRADGAHGVGNSTELGLARARGKLTPRRRHPRKVVRRTSHLSPRDRYSQGVLRSWHPWPNRLVRVPTSTSRR